MKEYKLIKYELDDERICTIPCPYGKKCAVYSEACIHCINWKGAEPDHVKCSYEYNHKIKTSSDCGSDCVCKQDHIVEPNKKVNIQEFMRTIRFNNGQQSIYLDITNNKHSFKLRAKEGEVFKFGGGHNALKRWRGVAELILEAIDYLEKGEV
jgi:hypothetical protein